MSVEVSQMTVDELREMIGAIVEEKLKALLENEDDLELTDELQERLLRQTKEIENGERGELLEDVVARLGLN
jgi:nucleotidyltransferase/DNA polymerase involved in DNA repair